MEADKDNIDTHDCVVHGICITHLAALYTLLSTGVTAFEPRKYEPEAKTGHGEDRRNRSTNPRATDNFHLLNVSVVKQETIHEMVS